MWAELHPVSAGGCPTAAHRRARIQVYHIGDYILLKNKNKDRSVCTGATASLFLSDGSEVWGLCSVSVGVSMELCVVLH